MPVSSAMMAVTVRRARPGDGDAIARAWLSAADYYTGLDPGRFQVPRAEGLAELWEEHICQGGADSLYLVAELDGRVIGCLTAHVEPPQQNAALQLTRDQGQIRLAVDALVVAREHWRHGAGAALLQTAESWGRARGAQIVQLDTYAHSPVSVPFYERKMGYQRRAVVFEKPLRSSDP